MSVAAAEGDYQSAVVLGQYTDSDRDSDYTANSLGYYYYLYEVKPDGVPLAEAEYLKRVSSINVNYIETESSSPVYLDTKGQRYSLSFDSRNPESDFTYHINYYNNDTDYFNSSDARVGSINYQRYRVDVGYYVAQNTNVSFGYTKYKKKSDVFSLTYTSSDRYTISAKHMILNGDSTAWKFYAYITRVSYANSENNRSQGMYMNYYISPRYNFGGGIEISGGSNEFNNGIYEEINGSAFFTPTFFVGFAMAKFKADNTAVRNDDDIMSISAGFRF
jgi:hypothetical protein